jgi:NAD(P)-dependent dehydrogenase (short-subunit alcohol dehydrogenase family)
MRYDGKVTIVTGGSQGIGQGCVRVFADAGAQVVFCARGAKEGGDL